MIKAVLDCNVFISALIQPKGHSAHILESIVNREFECILSSAILEEIRRVLGYPRISRRIVLSLNEQESFLDALSVLSLWVADVAPERPLIANDPDDDIYIQAAIQGDAGFIVSGDEHLLKLKQYQGIAIVTPRLFFDILAPAR